MNERQPRLWRPPPPPLPTAWTPRPRVRGLRLLRQFVASIVCNLIPFAGYVALDWPAQDVVLLGSFNVGFVAASLAASECARRRLIAVDEGELRRGTARWALLAVALNGLLIFALAAALRVPLALQFLHATFDAHAAAFLGSALAVAGVAYAAYLRELRDQLSELRAWIPPVRLRPLTAAGAGGAMAIALLFEAWMLRLVLEGLADAKIGETAAVVVVIALSLAFDAFRVLVPDEFHARRPLSG